MGSGGCRRFWQQPTHQTHQRANACSAHGTRHTYAESGRCACTGSNENCARAATRARARCAG
eukprot:5828796-Prymnesium_polylepis.1